MNKKQITFSEPTDDLPSKISENHKKDIPSAMKKMSFYRKQYGFSEKELELIRKRFDTISKKKGKMNKDNFRESLGLLGLEHATFLSDRLFNIINTQNNGQISYQEFLDFLSIALNGSQSEKAQLGFKFLDFQRKQYITFQEMEKLMFDLRSKIIPQKDYVKKIWEHLNLHQQDQLDFQKYFQFYDCLDEVFDWFTFFNEVNTQEKKNKQVEQQKEQEQERIFNQSKSYLSLNAMDMIQDKIHQCILLIKDYQVEKRVLQQRGSDSFLSESGQQIFSQFQNSASLNGPCYISVQTSSNQGDDDPINESLEITKLYHNQNKRLDKFQNDQLSNRNTQLDKLEQQFSTISGILEELQQKQEKGDESLEIENDIRMKQSSIKRRVTVMNIPQKQHNISVYFGHENWNLILNMMIGMRKSLLSLQPEQFQNNEVQKGDYKIKHLHDILPQRTQNFDSRKVFHFIDYAPTIFYRIRRLYGVQNQEYQKSIGPENMLGQLLLGKLNSLSELGSSGKSGSFFYFTEDNKYMIKTISVDEAKFLKRILESYYTHISNNFNTLISRIYGFHKMKIFKSKNDVQKIYLTVIVNVFSNLEIDFRYDIKGSLYGRQTKKNVEDKIDPSIALKDLDMLREKHTLKLSPADRILFEQQIKLDGMFFKQNDIIDYSLLIGYHKIMKSRYSQYSGQKRVNKNKRFYERDEGGIVSVNQDYIYFVGIIDILTYFNSKKQWEHGIKSTFVSQDVSCIPPLQYFDRFQEFIFKSVLDQLPLRQF